MKKLFTVLFTFSLLSQITFAQMNNMSIGLNGTLSIPIGDFNDIAKMGYGLSGSFFYELSERFEATGTLGFISWGADKIEVANTSVEATESQTTIPILVGARYYFEDRELNPYATAELGLHIFSSPGTKSVINGFETDLTKGETNLNFGFGFGGGVVYELDSSIKVDGNLMYNVISAEQSLGHFALELGIIIGIN